MKNLVIVRGFPILQKPPESDFNGAFHIICASGLGNHFHDFSLATTLHKLYPKSEVVLWASTHHREFASRLKNISVRWYSVSSKNNSNFEFHFDTEKVYSVAREEIIRSRKNGQLSYLVSAPFFPDGIQTFIGESVWECPYRILGLHTINSNMPKPTVPIEDSDRSDMQIYLENNGLFGHDYVVMTPHVVPGKSWKLDCFEKIAEKIWEKHKIRTIFTGFPNSTRLSVEGALQPYGISLPSVAALIEKSILYIGHDSGLTHMALFFDIPTLTIFIDKNVPPPFISVPVKNNTAFVGPFLGLPDNQAIDGALSWVESHLDQKPLQISYPHCLGCGNPAKFLLHFQESFSIWICDCGSSVKANRVQTNPETSNSDSVVNFDLSIFPQKKSEIEQFKTKILEDRPATFKTLARIPFRFNGSFFIKEFNDTDIDFISSWEGIFAFMKNIGYFPISASWTKDQGYWIATLRFSATKGNSSIFIPFEESLIKIPSYDIAMRYYRGSSWISYEYFSKIWKLLAQWHHNTDALRMSIETFRLHPSLIGFRNMTRCFFSTLKNKVQNMEVN